MTLPGFPLVSVLMPAFNHEAYVEAAVRSVMDQSYAPIELIAIDDGSSDDTPSILDRLSNELGFVFLRNHENLGLNCTLERAMANSRGDYLSILASDDLILPNKISRQIDHIQCHGLDGVYGNGFILSADGRKIPIDLHKAKRHFAAGTLLQLAYCDDTQLPLLQSGLFRREALISLAPYRRDFQSDDWVMLIKLLENYQIGLLDERLFIYRQHEANSWRRYWHTFPMRVDVVSKVTPEPYRARAMATIFASHAKALRADGRKKLAYKFMFASLALNPSPVRGWDWLRAKSLAAARRVRRVLRA
jgi:glycosyltransferase involved in cell wall biosynthesis